MSEIVNKGIIEVQSDGGIIQVNGMKLSVGFKMLKSCDVSSYSIGILDFGAFLNIGINEIYEGRNSASSLFKYPFIDLILDQVTSRGDTIQIEASENRFDLCINSIQPYV